MAAIDISPEDMNAFHLLLRIAALQRAVIELKVIADQDCNSCGFGGWYNQCKTASEHGRLAIEFKPVGGEYSQPF